MNFETELNAGDKAYYEIIEGFIVPVTILKVEIPFGIESDGYWYYKTQESEYVTYSTHEFKLHVSPIKDIIEIKKRLEACTSKGYTFYWIDEPVGHSIELGYDDGLYKTLDEAFKTAEFTNKRLSHRKHKKIASWRKRHFEGIYPKEPINWFDKFNELNKKPIYIKR